MTRIQTATLLSLLLLPTSASASAIGIFATPDCQGTCATVPSGGTLSVFVRADVPGGPGGNMTGAEFRVAGLPAGWSASATPAAELNLVLGSPVGDGVGVAFAHAVHGPCVSLFRVDIQVTSEASDVVLAVVAHTAPSNPSFACPVVMIDCASCLPRTCATGGEFVINPTNGCTVNLERRTWSVLKQVFR